MKQKDHANRELSQSPWFWIAIVVVGLVAGFLVGLFLL